MKYPLSYSAYKLFHECPAKYDNHHNKRLRTKTTPAFFIHGNAIDKACNALLEGKDLLEALKVCTEELERLSTDNVVYDERDYDGELISDMSALLAKLRDVGYKGDDANSLVDALLAKQMNGEALSDGQRKALNIAMTESIVAKCVIMLSAYQRIVMPLIKKVHSVQKNVKRGIMDMEIELYGAEGILVADNKTAYRRWDSDCVVTSVQLAGYGAKAGAYFVMNKVMKKNRIKTCVVCSNVATSSHKTCNKELDGKRCGGEWSETISPECEIQVFVDQISQMQRDLVENAYQETEKAIEAGCFPKNLNNCEVSFGRKKVKCDFYEFCRSGSTEGLIVKSKDHQQK